MRRAASIASSRSPPPPIAGVPVADPSVVDGPLPSLRPTDGDERLSLLDALRGFALGGVFLANSGALMLWFYLSSDQQAALPTAAFDRVGIVVLSFFVFGKFITLFALLFGLGFAVQIMRAEARGGNALSVYARRLLVLLLIGLGHATLLWWGDVLRFYAVLGFGLLLVRRASPRLLLWSGLVLGCLGPALLGLVVDPLLQPVRAGLPTTAAANASALAAFSGASYFDVVRMNSWYDMFYAIGHWSTPVSIFARFLLGFWAGRMLLLHDPARHRTLLARILAWSVTLGILGNAVILLSWFGGLKEQVPALTEPIGRAMLEVVTSTGPLALGIAYATGFALLYMRPAWRARLDVFAPVGRMALTNYLGQTVVLIAVFYGIGLGIGPRFGLPGQLVAVALVFGAQILVSRWWLARYRFGPMEWVWRSLTYGRAQPMRVV